MASQLLLEIGTEELPASFIEPALAHLSARIGGLLDELQITHSAVEVGGTPRRLAVWAREVAERQEDLEEVRTGPAVKAAFDAEGRPTRAAEGFARGAGVEVDALFRIDTPKGEYLAARVVRKGRDTIAVLAEALPGILGATPFRKSMRWGSGSTTFGRPLRGLCAIFGDAVIPFEFAGLQSGRSALGHRLMAPAPQEVHSIDGYLKGLEASFVLVDIEERRRRIRGLLAGLAAEAGGRLVSNEALVEEVANLVEHPWAALGSFDASNLELPREVLLSSMTKHQRYFAFEDASGRLLPVFGVVYNTKVRDPKVVVHGNQRVLRARLHDAGFFYAEDRKRTLAERVADLSRVTFLGELEGVGVGADLRSRAWRVEELAGFLARLAYPGDEDVMRDARRAAKLAKTDLVTQMVGEFPDLQGTIGMYYGRADGESEEVSAAIGEHYAPRGSGDAPARSPAGICVALADKLDLIASCFAVSLIPTGNKDPYGLRRAALGILKTLDAAGLDLNLRSLCKLTVRTLHGSTDQAKAHTGLGGDGAADVVERLAEPLLEFIGGRLRAELLDQHRTDIVDAVMAAGFDRPQDVRRRVEALAAIAQEADLAPLGEAFKRINNILTKNAAEAEQAGVFALEATSQDEERRLGELALELQQGMAEQLAAGNHRGGLAYLVRLQQPLDAFFTAVMVMHEDVAVRRNRLALLRDLRGAFAAVADISRVHVSRG